MSRVTDKQVRTINNMSKWVSPKALHNNGVDYQKIAEIQKNIRSIRILISSGYIRKYSADSQVIQNIFTFLSNILDKQAYNKMHVIGKDKRPYYQREDFYKRLDEQKAFYQKHGIWRKR